MVAWFTDVDLVELAPPSRVTESFSMALRLATGKETPSLNGAVGFAAVLAAWGA